MTGFLASVTSVEEAHIALTGGADIIDMKDPNHGALGALPLNTIADMVKKIDNKTRTSATIGDLKASSGHIPAAVRALQSTGVDFIKTGFFHGSGDLAALAGSLEHETSNCKLIAVLFADQPLQLSLLPLLAEAGFYGVMLDTARKLGSGLRASITDHELVRFVTASRQLGLVSGLAGQLTTSDIPTLLQIAPDYLGFRSALCIQQQRTQTIDTGAMATVSGLLGSHRKYKQCQSGNR